MGEGGARSAPDEGFLSAETDPSPVSPTLRVVDPPSPTRGEGKVGRRYAFGRIASGVSGCRSGCAVAKAGIAIMVSKIRWQVG
jgi:hypothetical protein